MSVRLTASPFSWNKSVPNIQVFMESDFRTSVKVCRQKSGFIKITEGQNVPYKTPKCINNHNPLNYLNNEKYFRESSGENQNTYFIYPTKFSSGPRSVVGIASAYGLDGPGIESRCGRDFPHLSRQSLRSTQHPLLGTGFSRR